MYRGCEVERTFADLTFTCYVTQYYTNKFYINTTAGDIVSGTIQGVTHYANNALHGFGYW
jgi:hypothetical protein